MFPLEAFLQAVILAIDPNNCVFQMTCFPSNPLGSFDVYYYVYGIPKTVILGLIVGLCIAIIYLKNRSLTVLAILGTYSIAALGATWANEASIAKQYGMALYVIVFAVATAVVILFLKVTKE